MDLGLDGRLTLVAGAGEGTGRAIALAFAAEGADLVIAARRPEPLARVAAEIEARGRPVLAVAADLSTTAGVERVVAAAVERFGRIDVLVNSFGRAVMKPFLAARGVPREAIFEVLNAEWGHVTYADRPCRPEEIGALCAFLASDVAAYVNGATVNIDGGTNFP